MVWAVGSPSSVRSQRALRAAWMFCHISGRPVTLVSKKSLRSRVSSDLFHWRSVEVHSYRIRGASGCRFRARGSLRRRRDWVVSDGWAFGCCWAAEARLGGLAGLGSFGPAGAETQQPWDCQWKSDTEVRGGI